MQDLLVREVATAIYSERRLHYLSLKPVLRFVAISSFPYDSWMMRGTTSSAFVSDLVLGKSKSTVESETMLAVEVDAKEVEANKDVRIGAGAFLATLAEDFFLAGWQTLEVVAEWFPLGACLNFPYCLSFSL